jgi:hypothetical protein
VWKPISCDCNKGEECKKLFQNRVLILA